MDKPFAITLDVGSSLANKTGSWRVERPVYVDRLPPCSDACPAGENIQQWLYHTEDGSYEAAWRQIMLDNPFPAVMGRACFHPCQTACNRATVDETVGINSVERFLGDRALSEGWRPDPPGPSTGRRVLVVGSGPGGLAAAYHLRRLGHDVVLYEAAPLPGGMMRYGIPAYRLPRDVVQAEIDRILDMGVEIQCGRRVDDLHATMDAEGFDAAFLAVGAQMAHNAGIPAGDTTHVLDAVSLLRGVEDHGAPSLGRRVAVYGGGDTAMDVARTAKRLGAEDTVVVYRRTRDRMPAHDEEVEDAVGEGVRIQWLSTVKAATGTSFVIEKMVLDESGFPRPTGEVEELQADSLVLALGQEADLSLLRTPAGGGHRRRRRPGGSGHGDRTPGRLRRGRHGERPAHPHRCRRTGQARGARHRRLSRAVSIPDRPPRHPLATADRLNTWYYADAPKTVRPRLEARPAGLDLRRGRGWARRDDRPVRSAPLPLVRQLFRMRQLLRRLPGQRRPEGGGRPRLPLRLRLLQGLWAVRRGMPVRGDRHGPGGDLTPF